jgi:DnaK suppressor protein
MGKGNKEIKDKIQSEIRNTELEISDLKELTKPIAPENAIGRLSRMDAINNKSIYDAALVKAQDKLQKLQIAERNVDKPDFGICVKCGKPIPIGRILLMPQSNRCVNCA